MNKKWIILLVILGILGVVMFLPIWCTGYHLPNGYTGTHCGTIFEISKTY